ncbi:MAG: hypothetical protein AVDCRST_MAG17-1290, partial [uncultured Solirubrobacterales bacterium]
DRAARLAADRLGGRAAGRPALGPADGDRL